MPLSRLNCVHYREYENLSHSFVGYWHISDTIRQSQEYPPRQDTEPKAHQSPTADNADQSTLSFNQNQRAISSKKNDLAEAQNSKGWTDDVNAVSTLVITVFTVGMFLAVIVQVQTSRHIERAWVMAELFCNPGTLLSNTSGDGSQTTALMQVELRCSNAGRSPAWITQKLARLVVVEHGKLPNIPELNTQDVIQDGPEPLSPDSKPTIFVWYAVGKGKHSIAQLTIIYGVVRYRDIFGKQRETCFPIKSPVQN